MNRTLYGKRDGMYGFCMLVAVFIVFQLIVGLAFPGGVDANPVVYWIVNAFYSLLIGATALFYALITKTDIRSAAKLNAAPPALHILFGLLAVFFLINFMTPVNEWVCDLIEMTGLERPSVSIPTDNVAALIIVACLIPAFTEELIFRGTVGNGFTDGSRNKAAAVAVSGALFALFHMNPAQTLHQFILGCLLTVFVMRSGSLWVGVIAHLFNNLCAVVLSYTVEPTGFYDKYDWIIVVVSGILLAASLFCYFHFAKDRRAVKNGSSAEFTAVVRLSVTDKLLFGAACAVCAVFWIATLLL